MAVSAIGLPVPGLLREPEMLLTDEPFGALTLEKMNFELHRTRRETRTTVMPVTHSVGDRLPRQPGGGPEPEADGDSNLHVELPDAPESGAT